MKLLKLFIKSMPAGVLVSIAATIYLCVENSVVGAILFSFGLFTVSITQSTLFTGIAGYFPQRKWWELVVSFCGNFTGCMLYGAGYSLSGAHDKIYDRVYQLCDMKFSSGWGVAYIMAIFCGILMFLGVDTFKKHRDVVGVTVGMLCISGFIISGFENSMANMAYLALSHYELTLEVILKLIVMGLGNFTGAILTRLVMQFNEK